MPELETSAHAMENRWLRVVLGVCFVLISFFSQQTYSTVQKSLTTLEEVQRDVMLMKVREAVRPAEFYELRGEVRALRMRVDRIAPARR